jgi:hypothetical protein
MDRYEILLGKHRENKEPEVEAFQTFGFDNELDEIKKSWKKRVSNYFSLEHDEVARVGIVYEDPKKLFTGTYTHFCRTYFLCKSTEGRRELCCDYSKRVFRTGCVLIIYLLPPGVPVAAITSDSPFQIKPWIFGTQTYNSLKGMHEQFPVFNHDIILRRNNKTLRTYDIQPTQVSLWNRSGNPVKEKIITEARPIIKNMKDYIGADLSLDEIAELIKNDSQPRSNITPNMTCQSLR